MILTGFLIAVFIHVCFIVFCRMRMRNKPYLTMSYQEYKDKYGRTPLDDVVDDILSGKDSHEDIVNEILNSPERIKYYSRK